MKAIILAGGNGRRLRPLTDKLPKPMIPVMNKPILAHILDHLKQYSITEIAITLSYRGEIIRDYFKDGEDFGVRLTYFQETEPLGTAGALKNAASFLTEDFVVMSGDIICDINLSDAISFHNEKKAPATLILKETDSPVNYGTFVTDDTGQIRHFYNHPDWDEVRSNTVNTGIYIMKPEILQWIPEQKHFDFTTHLFPTMLQKNISLYGYITKNYWCDISDISAYRQCHIDIFNQKMDVNISSEAQKSGVLVGENCEIAPDAKLERYTVVGSHSKIGSGATVKDCILWKGTEVPEHTDLYRSVACGNEKIDVSTLLTEDETFPICQKNYFTGTLNKEITPEFIIRLCVAYANTLKVGAKILLSLSDDSRYMMPKFAFLSGLIAGGAEAYNLVDAGDRCVARFALRKLSLDGGMHIQITDQKIIIELFDSDGTPIDKAKMKTIKSRIKSGDLIYVNPKHFMPPINVRDIPLYYFKDLIKTTPCKRLNFSIGICSHETELKNHIKKIATAFGLSVLFTNDEGYLPQLITGNKLNFGVLIGDNGKCALYDENGKVLSGDMFYELITLIILSAVENATVLMPQHVSDAVCEIAKQLGGNVKRTQDYTMEAELLRMNTPAARLQHSLCYDPISSIVRICEFLFLNRSTLSHICSLLPTMYKISKKVDCPTNKKASVMRRLLSAVSNEKITDLTDGLKIIDEHGWVLIMPDLRRNQLHILAESKDEEYACELAGDICKLVDSMIQ